MLKNQKVILLALGFAAFSLLGFYIKNSPEEEKTTVRESQIQEQIPAETAAAQTGSYEAYDASKIARAADGAVILFFHASWCPSCRALNTDIEKNLSTLPEKVSILKTDYDTEGELKKKYGVTYQHTLVQVDQNGEMIKKWSGSPSLNSLLSQISAE